MNKHKLASVVLSVATLLVMVGAPLANAQSTASLQAQIATLLAQIQTLQAQLGTSSATTGTTYNFTSDLTVGSTGAQVMQLQQFLIAKGDLVLATPTTYFGALTQAALAKFQAANGITPSVGYFGPKTRAFINSMSTTGTGTGTGTTTVPTGAPLTIAVDAQTPGSSNVAAGAVNTPVLKLDFTAGTTPVTVTNLVLTRSGLSQDSDLNNVYLYNGATKLASNLGFNNGAITFSNGAGLFTVPANSTYVVTVTADVAGTGANNTGHIFQIGLASAANVTGGTFTGNFPLNSAQFTIASVSNLATLSITSVQTASTTVNAGQLDDLVGQMTVQAGNNPVKVTSVNFTNVGSVTPSYLQNVKLMNGSTQLGATISSLGSNNIATFDLSANPLMLTSGQSAVLSLYADITGGVNRNFQFSIQQSSDIQAVDTTYGVGIGATSTVGSFPINFSAVTINNGGVVASRDAASPTTNAVAGNTNQPLAKFDVLASGDSIKFNELDFTVTGNPGLVVNNFRVVDDQGAQIGTTVNTTIAGTNTSTVTEGSGSLNYIIPANTTRVLTVYGDLLSNASGSVQVALGGGNTSAQSYTTYAPASVAPVPGNNLTILSAGSNLTVSQNYGLGSPVKAAAAAQNVKIGSYTFTAGQVNPINLSGVTITVTSTMPANYLTNLTVMNGTSQIGTPYSTVVGNNAYSFNTGTPILIPAGGSVTIDVYANIYSNVASSTYTVGTSLTGVNASTLLGNAVNVSSTAGQNISFNTGGALSASIAAGTAQASYLGMNVPGVAVAQYKFQADQNGAETLTQVHLTDSSTSTTSTAAADHSTFFNYRLVDSSGNVWGTASENASGTLLFNSLAYNGTIGVPVPVNSAVYLTLVADTNSYPSAVSGSTHAFALNSYQYSNASNSTTTNVTTNNIGNLFTVYQASLNITAGSFSNPTSISGVGNTVGAFNFAVGAGAVQSVQLKSLTLVANGSLIQGSTTQVLGVYYGTTLLATSTVASTTAATFNLTSINTNAEAIDPGTSQTLVVEPMSSPSNLATVTSGGGNYQLILKNITWSDGVTTSITGFSPALGTQVPGQSISGLTN